jgi:hypothetical protein
MKTFGFVIVALAASMFLSCDDVPRRRVAASQTEAADVSQGITKGGQQPRKEAVIALSYGELTSNPKLYAGKRVTVNEKLTLWSIQSWYEIVCGNWPVDAPGPCIPSGGPHNPRCEYRVSLQVFAPNAPVIEGCVPRSKVDSLAGAWGGETGVRFIGTVAPASSQGTKGWAVIRDMEIIQPSQNTDERWPDERPASPPKTVMLTVVITEAGIRGRDADGNISRKAKGYATGQPNIELELICDESWPTCFPLQPGQTYQLKQIHHGEPNYTYGFSFHVHGQNEGKSFDAVYAVGPCLQCQQF